ncbi:hypothetical protein [Sinorhizobium arboris]|uniref:hypothetical protein n=1 Tax=Sinorhizobium arboris TaxID=76745 RepID=UPI0012432603|nr:hypothetical protein [Sinorhizobium arboris]
MGAKLRQGSPFALHPSLAPPVFSAFPPRPEADQFHSHLEYFLVQYAEAEARLLPQPECEDFPELQFQELLGQLRLAPVVTGA